MHLLYSHGSHTGYSRYGSGLAGAFDRAGVSFTETLSATDRPHHLAVWVATPAMVKGWFDGQHKVMCTMWETATMPEGRREGLHNFDQIIVPSDHNVELFSRYHWNVSKAPLGVDADDWRYRNRQPHDRRFVFLVCGDGPRKGVDVAVEAFRRVFPSGRSFSPQPTLIIKSGRPSETLGERIQNVTGRLSTLEEIELYAAAHCYLGPSRGEGFGLMPLQAIASGLPTILTGAHGHLEYSTLGVEIGATKSKAGYFLYGDAGDWWEPNLEQLCEAMSDMYGNYDRHVKEARVNSDIARNMFSWDRCAQRVLDEIGVEHFVRNYSGDRVWTEPDVLRYPTQVDRMWRCEVAGTVYQFDPGRLYFETAEVKRILFDAGVLDPTCVDPDHPQATGLAAEQLNRLGEYSASHAYCHHCGQKLGSGVRYDDT